MSSSTPAQQAGQPSPTQQQGQSQAGSSKPGTEKPAPQQSGGTVIKDWASI